MKNRWDQHCGRKVQPVINANENRFTSSLSTHQLPLKSWRNSNNGIISDQSVTKRAFCYILSKQKRIECKRKFLKSRIHRLLQVNFNNQNHL